MDTADAAPPTGLRFVFLLCLVAAPSVIFLHEVGHFVGYSASGARPELFAAFVSVDDSTHSQAVIGALCGPLVETAFGLLGLYWLRRRGAPPTDRLGWVATIMALCWGRWLRTPFGLCGDERWLSEQLGLPEWALPYALFALALAAYAWVVRQHPAGKRLLPFAVAFAGGACGAVLWVDWVGPALLGGAPLFRE